MPPFGFRLERSAQPLTGAYLRLPVAPRRATLLGLSFRPLQAAAFGLDPRAALEALLAYPFQLIRLGAYWNRLEPEPGVFEPGELDWQIETAERSGKQIILCLGPLKTFGYPEFFVPAHRLSRPFAERHLVRPEDYPGLLQAAQDHIARLVERYRSCESILAWQLEHEAVDPLGVEHSWRLSAAFVEQEARALRQADPSRPLMMNGYLPTSLPVRLNQGWSTRDQGDSLALAQRLAEWVGIDYYPRNALFSLAGRTLYLDGSRSGWLRQKREQLFDWARTHGKQILIAEGQAEPWETVTVPPSPAGHGMYSCLPEHIIANYNDWLGESHAPSELYAYLFWGAEYWLLQQRQGNPAYLQAFTRILDKSS